MIIVILIVLGLCLGSFVNALVWRLHERSAILDAWGDKKPTKAQAKKLDQLSIVKGRSICPHCQHQLAWYDLLPVISWASLGGKCRYCQKPISIQYPLVELMTAALLVLSYIWWPYDVTQSSEIALFAIWCTQVVLLMALLVYDMRWKLLPDVLSFPLMALALVFAVIKLTAVTPVNSLVEVGAELLFGVIAVAGLYYLLYSFSYWRYGQDKTWVGLGDVKLGVSMGLILGWQLGLLSIFLANVIGLLVILPGLVTGKLTAKSHIPFGPFLIGGLVVALLFGAEIINWYVSNILYI